MKDAKKYIMNGPIEAVPMTYGQYLWDNFAESATYGYSDNTEGYALNFNTSQKHPHWMPKELFDATFYLLQGGQND